jgi:putative SOS response-associated peptidase YedK
MCNAYRLRTPIHQAFDEFSEIRLPMRIADPARIPNQPLELIRPTDTAPIFRPVAPTDAAAGVELVMMRWGLIPWFHRGGLKDWKFLTTNARSEDVGTTRTYRDAYKSRRCLIPADGYFEWTGPKGGKTKWVVTRTDGAWWCFAGLWERWKGPDGPVESYTMMTTTPGPDVAELHSRQPVVLERAAWAEWLDLGSNAGALLRGAAAGTLRAETA